MVKGSHPSHSKVHGGCSRQLHHWFWTGFLAEQIHRVV